MGYEESVGHVFLGGAGVGTVVWTCHHRVFGSSGFLEKGFLRYVHGIGVFRCNR